MEWRIMQMSFSEAVFLQTKELCARTRMLVCLHVHAQQMRREAGWMVSFAVSGRGHSSSLGFFLLLWGKRGREWTWHSLSLKLFGQTHTSSWMTFTQKLLRSDWRRPSVVIQWYLRYSAMQEEAEEPVCPVSGLFTVKQTCRKRETVGLCASDTLMLWICRWCCSFKDK